MPDSSIPIPARPACAHQDCAEPPTIQWQRRPTETELAGLVHAEVQRRETATLLADPQLAPPAFGPLPAYDTTTIAVLACHDHAIALDAAAQIHADTCQAPHPDHLPACDCTPEPLPDPVPVGVNTPTVTLPAGWVMPAPPQPQET